MCVPAIIGAAAIVGGAVAYSGAKAAKATKNASKQAAAQAQQAQAQAQAEAKQREEDRKFQQEQTDKLIAQMRADAQAQQETLTQQNTLLTQQLGQQSEAFKTSLGGLLDEQKKATALAMKAAEDAKNVGQKERKPNYGKAIAENIRKNRGGQSSTLLTGSLGVPTGDLALGKTSLLGAAA